MKVLITGISAATGTCFAVLAGLGISAAAFPVRRFHGFSVVLAAVALAFAYLAFRAAVAGKADKDTASMSLRAGIIGAFIALLVIGAFIVMFKAGTQSFLAHALGKPTSAFTSFRLLIASVLLGFGAGFVLRVPREAPKSDADEDS